MSVHFHGAGGLLLLSASPWHSGVLSPVSDSQLLHFGCLRAGCKLFVRLMLVRVVTASATQHVPRSIG